MKINDTYSRKETEKRSRILLALSIIAPTILLVILTILNVIVSTNTIKAKQERQLDTIAEAVRVLAFWDEETGVAEAVSACKVIYYTQDGSAKNIEPGFAEKYDVSVNNVEVRVDGKDYKCRAGKMASNGDGLYNYIVYMDITSDNVNISRIIWMSAVILAVAFFVLLGMMHGLVNMQMKIYEKSINRNNQLVSDISHEFNTPLAIIKSSMAKIMAEPEEKVENVSESLVTVTHEAGRLSRMVKDMLVLSRSDNERLIVEKTNCDITAIVKEVVEPFEMMCELDHKKMIVDIEEGVAFRVDEDKLRQALIILLDNATKYTIEGESVSVRLFTTFSRYVIEVADTGDGVPQSELQNIFERFYRIDKSRTQQTGGSGLGLSIVKAIMVALNGRVYAEINDPKGLKISLEFSKEKFTQNLQNEKE